MRIISVIFALACCGCSHSDPPSVADRVQTPPPSAEELAMPAADPPSEAAADEPSLSVPVLAWAVATEEMPQVMQDRLDASPAVFTLAEVRALDASEKAEILAVVEKAIVHFENQAEAYRAQGNTAQHTADELSAFLEAARD